MTTIEEIISKLAESVEETTLAKGPLRRDGKKFRLLAATPGLRYEALVGGGDVYWYNIYLPVW